VDFLTVDTIGSSGCTHCSSLKSPADVCTWQAARHIHTGSGSPTRRGTSRGGLLLVPVGSCCATMTPSSRASFEAVFQALGTRIVRTPVQMTEANGIVEGFVSDRAVRVFGLVADRERATS
jgi:hypothetical protein